MVGDRKWRGLAGVALAAVGVVAAVGTPLAAGWAGGNAGAAPAKGPVDVLYAGSLVTVMQTSIGPAFTKATGYTVTGISGGSTGLAQEIKGGVHQADVFVSASPSADQTLMGAANGNWVSWYLTFARSPLVLGYNPSSAFAKTLRTKPWYRVVTEPGFLLGRTNPVTDPKGVLTVDALKDTAGKVGDPTLAAVATKATTIFPETTLVGRLQAGQLDAGFFYAVEASAAKIPTVPLKGVKEQATYTVTVVAKAPHRAGASAFVAFMLSPKAKKLLKRDGVVEISPPELTGPRAAVPKGLRKVVG
ncbi:MAG TPA: extracellular solute-binding protein [Acidimicrobiales bacterium]|nr:extracellular solute-binding protein [Acidimicrobiales bacterium]